MDLDSERGSVRLRHREERVEKGDREMFELEPPWGRETQRDSQRLVDDGATGAYDARTVP